MSWYVQNAEEALAERTKERPRQRKGSPGRDDYGREAFDRWANLLSAKGDTLQRALGVKVGRIRGCGKYGCVVDSGPKRVLKLTALPDYGWDDDEELKFWTKMKDEQRRPDSPASEAVVKVDKVWVVTDKDTDQPYMVVLREEAEPFSATIPDPDRPPGTKWVILKPTEASMRRGVDDIPIGAVRPGDLSYYDVAVPERIVDPVLLAINEYRLGDVHLGNIGWVGDRLVIYDADFGDEAPGPDEQLRVNSHYERARQEFYKMTEQLPGGLASGMQPEDFDAEELKRGIAAEMEHTDDRALAAEIAMDHLVEDPLYYDKREGTRGARRPRRRIHQFRLNAGSQVGDVLKGSELGREMLQQERRDREFNEWATSLDEEMAEYAFDWKESWILGGRPPEPPGDRFREAADVRRRITTLYPPPPAERRRPGFRDNAGIFYVFEMRGGKPYRQVNVKPLTLDKAKQLARIGAQQGKHDRVVTTDPRKDDFRVVGEYEAGLTENRRCPVGTEVQTLIFDSELFTASTAKSWAKQHGFKYGKVDSKEETHRLRQAEPGEFRAGSFRTISFAEGVQAVIGCPR